MHHYAARLLRLIFPWSCAACGVELTDVHDAGFCTRCWLNLPRIEGLVCIRCGLPLPEGGLRCAGCRRAPPDVRMRAALLYKGGLPDALYRFKYFGRESLHEAFSALMAVKYPRYFPEPADFLIPVPLHPAAERQRGYNQAHLLAGALSRRLNIPLLDGALVRTRRTRAQHRLTRSERQENVAGAFDLGPAGGLLRGKQVLLIDDACTTGSTFDACARVLKEARPTRVQGFSLARDEQPFDRTGQIATIRTAFPPANRRK